VLGQPVRIKLIDRLADGAATGEGGRCRRQRQAHSKEAPSCMSALCASS
jgi:hypothetical protein